MSVNRREFLKRTSLGLAAGGNSEFGREHHPVSRIPRGKSALMVGRTPWSAAGPLAGLSSGVF
jgi:hypothetical protein